MKVRITIFTLAAFLGVVAAFAAGETSIIARKACMKAQGAAVPGLFYPMLRGEKKYDSAQIERAFENVQRACKDWAQFWPEESKTSDMLETGVKPEIWSDAAGFAKVSQDAEAALTALGAAKDEAGFKAALPAVGAACQGCHEKYRVKTE